MIKAWLCGVTIDGKLTEAVAVLPATISLWRYHVKQWWHSPADTNTA